MFEAVDVSHSTTTVSSSQHNGCPWDVLFEHEQCPSFASSRFVCGVSSFSATSGLWNSPLSSLFNHSLFKVLFWAHLRDFRQAWDFVVDFLLFFIYLWQGVVNRKFSKREASFSSLVVKTSSWRDVVPTFLHRKKRPLWF